MYSQRALDLTFRHIPHNEYKSAVVPLDHASKGPDWDRTSDLRICSAVPSHLATGPQAEGAGVEPARLLSSPR